MSRTRHAPFYLRLWHNHVKMNGVKLTFTAKSILNAQIIVHYFKFTVVNWVNSPNPNPNLKARWLFWTQRKNQINTIFCLHVTNIGKKYYFSNIKTFIITKMFCVPLRTCHYMNNHSLILDLLFGLKCIIWIWPKSMTWGSMTMHLSTGNSVQ